MAYLQDAITFMDSIGVTEVILPFFLVFTIVFAVLQKMEIFGKTESKKFNIIIAVVLGLSVVIPHVVNPGLLGQYDVVNIINKALPSVSLLTIAIAMMLLIMGLWGFGITKNSGFTGVLMIISFVAVIYIFVASSGVINMPDFLENNPELLSLVIIVLVFGMIIAFVTGKEPEKGESQLAKFMDFLGGNNK